MIAVRPRSAAPTAQAHAPPLVAWGSPPSGTAGAPPVPAPEDPPDPAAAPPLPVGPRAPPAPDTPPVAANFDPVAVLNVGDVHAAFATGLGLDAALRVHGLGFHA